MQQMHALLLTDSGLRLRTDYPRPVPATGEALIRVTCAGICATDLQLSRGYKGGFNGVLGHEFVGVVTEAPDAPAWVGQRVVGEINIGCGTCALCGRGLAKHCRSRTAVGILGHDGAFADYLTLPVANLHPVPDALPDARAVFTEPLAAVLQIVEQTRLTPATKVYLIGAGRLGLLAAQVLAHIGCDLTVFSRSEAKTAVVTKLGAGRSVQVGSAAWDAVQGSMADLVVDTSGSPAGMEHALRFVRPGGTIVVKSTYADALPAIDLSRLVVEEITLLGSRCGPFAPALRLLADGVIQTEPLVSAVYSLEDGPDAFRHAAAPGVLKVLLTTAGGDVISKSTTASTKTRAGRPVTETAHG